MVLTSPVRLHAWGTPTAGIEPATTRLTAECSTAELSRKTNYSMAPLSQLITLSG